MRTSSSGFMVGPTLTPLAVSCFRELVSSHRVGDAAEVLDVRAVQLARAVADPDEVARRVVVLLRRQDAALRRRVGRTVGAVP